MHERASLGRSGIIRMFVRRTAALALLLFLLAPTASLFAQSGPSGMMACCRRGTCCCRRAGHMGTAAPVLKCAGKCTLHCRRNIGVTASAYVQTTACNIYVAAPLTVRVRHTRDGFRRTDADFNRALYQRPLLLSRSSTNSTERWRARSVKRGNSNETSSTSVRSCVRRRRFGAVAGVGDSIRRGAGNCA